MNTTSPTVSASFALLAVMPEKAGQGEISEAIRQSQEAFRAALPALLKSKTPSQKWVAFSGNQLVIFSLSKTETHQECLRRGLEPGTFVVRRIQPETPLEAEVLSDI